MGGGGFVVRAAGCSMSIHWSQIGQITSDDEIQILDSLKYEISEGQGQEISKLIA